MNLHVCFICALVALSNFGFSLHFPKSPCPDIYDYYLNEKDVYYGLVTLKNDNSSVHKIEVNMTLPMNTNETIYLIQVIPTFRVRNGETIFVLIKFPFNDTFPTLTSIRFNGEVYCNSTPKDGYKKVNCDDDMWALTPPSNLQNISEDFTVKTMTHLNRNLVIDTTILDLRNTTLPEQRNKINSYPDICGLTVDDATFSTDKKTIANGEYPWLVALFVFNKGKYDFKCGGNLISDVHVLTAAHCIKGLDRTVTNKRELLVVLGTTNIRNWAINGVSRGVERSVPHNDYVTPSVSDIALLTLDKPVDFDDNIRPVCIWDDLIDPKLLVGKQGIIAGWGLDEQRKVFINNAKQVKIPVIDQKMCLEADERYRWLTSKKTFCAGDRNLVNPCTGDSGSGFVIKHKGRWMLRGLVSTGLKDNNTNICETDLYTVFVDVGKYRKWIIEELKQQRRDEIHTDS